MVPDMQTVVLYHSSTSSLVNTSQQNIQASFLQEQKDCRRREEYFLGAEGIMILCEWDAPEDTLDNVAYTCMLSYPSNVVSHLSFNFLCLLLLQVSISVGTPGTGFYSIAPIPHQPNSDISTLKQCLFLAQFYPHLEHVQDSVMSIMSMCWVRAFLFFSPAAAILFYFPAGRPQFLPKIAEACSLL